MTKKEIIESVKEIKNLCETRNYFYIDNEQDTSDFERILQQIEDIVKSVLAKNKK